MCGKYLWHCYGFERCCFQLDVIAGFIYWCVICCDPSRQGGELIKAKRESLRSRIMPVKLFWSCWSPAESELAGQLNRWELSYSSFGKALSLPKPQQPQGCPCSIFFLFLPVWYLCAHGSFSMPHGSIFQAMLPLLPLRAGLSTTGAHSGQKVPHFSQNKSSRHHR